MGKFIHKLIQIAFLLLIVACTKEERTIFTPTETTEAEPEKGTLKLQFLFNDNDGCSIRDQIFIARTYHDLYIGGNYIATPNVYYNKATYIIDLPPGDYICMVTTYCICSAHKCINYGYGQNNDVKEYVEEFSVSLGETTEIVTFGMDAK